MIRLLLDTTTAQAQRKAGVELLQTLPNSITELLLISHRDLHRLPLHTSD